MSNPTSNFNWQMPTATDLVTDLPADFEVFGQAVDTAMADLKGGTTGQILAKNTNTDMDFVWVTNDVGDITAVTAGTGITGGGTSGAVTITNDMATTITASGDIVVGTGSGTYDNLPIGTTGQLLTADTTVSPYKVKWAAAPSADKTWTSIANGNIATGVSTTTITGLGGYDDVIILLYNRVTTANNVTYELTMNNTTTYFGSYFRSDAYGTGNDSAGTGSGFRLSSVNYAGTTASNDYILIRGCKSTGMKTFEYIYASGYLTQHYIVEGYTNSTAALSSFTITSNGTLNGGTYRILGA